MTPPRALTLPYDTEPTAPDTVTLGLIVLGPDETIEDDFHRMLLPGTARLLHSRIPSAPEVTAETLPRMAADLPTAAALLPTSARFHAIGYACTSGATVMGPARVTELIAQAHPGVPVTDPLSAVSAACRALGVQRLALVSPYVAEMSQALVDALGEAGLTVAPFGSFGVAEERAVARISAASIASALRRIGGDPACEAVFVSCTNLPALKLLEAVESELGKPVLTSNQALCWHMLRLAGLGDGPQSGGRLAACPLPAD